MLVGCVVLAVRPWLLEAAAMSFTPVKASAKRKTKSCVWLVLHAVGLSLLGHGDKSVVCVELNCGHPERSD